MRGTNTGLNGSPCAAPFLMELSRAGHSRRLQMAFLRKRSTSFLSKGISIFRQYPAATAVTAAASFLAATAVVNGQFAKKAQRDNPPQGRFIDVDGVRLHYVE